MRTTLRQSEAWSRKIHFNTWRSVETPQKKSGIFEYPNFLSRISPDTSLPCGPESKWVTLSSPSENRGKTTMKAMLKVKTSVCPCVEVVLCCLCTPLYSLFALNDQRRSTRDEWMGTAEQHKPTITGRTLSTLSICKWFMLYMSNRPRVYVDVSMFPQLPFLYLWKETFHCSPRFWKMYQLCKKETLRNDKYIKNIKQYTVVVLFKGYWNVRFKQRQERYESSSIKANRKLLFIYFLFNEPMSCSNMCKPLSECQMRKSEI